jgi:hypothetical protein
MTTGSPREPTCPVCGAHGVQGQLVPKKDFVGGVLTEYLTGDSAAGLMAMQMGEMIARAYCLCCGSQWLPGSGQEQYLRALSGQLGEEAKRLAQQHGSSEVHCRGCDSPRSFAGSVAVRGFRYCASCAAAGGIQ